MENKINVFFLAVLLFSLLLIVSSSLVGADPIIVDPNQNPFNYSANNTNPNNNNTNGTINYYENVTDQTLRKLIDALVNSSTLNADMKKYLESIMTAFNKNQISFNEALDKINYAYTTMKNDRDTAVNNYNKLQAETDTKFETLNTEIEGVRLDNTKIKAWSFFYVIMGLAIGVLVFQLAIYLKKNQKFYFVIRAIRDKIPIKF